MNRNNFEDTIFILNMRIRLIRDTLRLNPPPEIFLEKNVDELVYIDRVLDFIVQSFTENGNEFAGNNEFACASDTEWQFSQILTEFSLDSSPFSILAFPETRKTITALRGSSEARRRTLDALDIPADLARAEPVVSSAEFNGLLGGI